MMSSKTEALACIEKLKGSKQCSKDELQASIEILQNISATEGLLEDELHQLIEFLTTTKLAASSCLELFSCFVPKTKVLTKSLKQLLSWFFAVVSSEKISMTVEKKCIQWLTGVVFYELGDVTVIDSYYYSFLFLLKRPHMENCVCKLLCLISKPEDAKRWVVQQVLNIQQVNGLKMSTNSLLSLLKSYRPDIVPERVSVACFSYKNTTWNENLKKAHSRKQEKDILDINSQEMHVDENLQWNAWGIYDVKSKTIPRLIPAVENISLEFAPKQNENKTRSLMEFKTVASLGINLFNVKVPAQTLSLLANLGGYHLLAFSDNTTKARFSHRLHHTLWRVFLLELEPYSEKEKINFLNAIKGFQDYTHQSIPVVTTFLFNFLLIWDGFSYCEQILGLLEWIEIRNEEDLQKYVFPSLRQIFISSGVHCKFLIIETMGKLVKNLLVMDTREKNIFWNDFQECALSKSVQAISDFVSSLIVNGLIWNNEKKTRSILMAGLDFYNICQTVEQAANLATMVIMPPVLVYKCLFTGSRICIERLCFVLLQLQMNSLERLHFLGVFEDFADEVQQLNVYLMDLYRCLWNNMDCNLDGDSFIFNTNVFCQFFWRFKDNYGDIMNNIFCLENNFSFWSIQREGKKEESAVQMIDYPSVFQLKEVVERRLL